MRSLATVRLEEQERENEILYRLFPFHGCLLHFQSHCCFAELADEDQLNWNGCSSEEEWMEWMIVSLVISMRNPEEMKCKGQMRQMEEN